MLVVNLKGGLGNQMFQYALYTKLQQKGKQVYLDYSQIATEMQALNRSTIFSDFRLDRTYNLQRMQGPFGTLYRRFLIRAFRKLTNVLREKEESVYDAQVMQIKNGYLDGYWQSEKYFLGCEEELRQRLQFKQELSDANRAILEKIRSAKCPISIHVRLGDYQQAENAGLFGNICTRAYYEKAIAFCREKYEEAAFFVFSNEPQKAVEMLNLPNATIVDVNDELSAWADMYLMSKCHHNIIANSSFSWWAAWLNENPDKVIIAPSKWINGKQTPDIWPETWLRM